MNKHYLDLNYREVEQYWALMSIYETATKGYLESDEKEDFFDAFRTLQDLLKIELFTETSKLDILDWGYIRKYGHPFYEVFQKDGSNYIQEKTEVVDAVKEKVKVFESFAQTYVDIAELKNKYKTEDNF